MLSSGPTDHALAVIQAGLYACKVMYGNTYLAHLAFPKLIAHIIYYWHAGSIDS